MGEARRPMRGSAGCYLNRVTASSSRHCLVYSIGHLRGGGLPCCPYAILAHRQWTVHTGLS